MRKTCMLCLNKKKNDNRVLRSFLPLGQAPASMVAKRKREQTDTAVATERSGPWASETSKWLERQKPIIPI